jgi:hypothetical protein
LVGVNGIVLLVDLVRVLARLGDLLHGRTELMLLQGTGIGHLFFYRKEHNIKHHRSLVAELGLLDLRLEIKLTVVHQSCLLEHWSRESFRLALTMTILCCLVQRLIFGMLLECVVDLRLYPILGFLGGCRGLVVVVQETGHLMA